MARHLRILITLLFILSGLTSLVYETLWIRVLSLGIGSTSASMSMVLSIFFFGLSVGSFISGKICDRIKSPLKLYGAIEGGIGLYSLALIYVLLQFPTIMSWLPVESSLSWLAFLIKFAWVFVLLIIPTVGMGATLPLLVRILSEKKFGVGKNVSWLYTVNTIGAVIGAFITGYFLIPAMGVLAANHTMVVVNVLIFVACWFVPLKFETAPAKKATKESSDQDRWQLLSKNGLKTFLICGIVGFSSIGAEVIWSKYLGIFFGTNIFGLSLILSIFLFGIALGSFLLSKCIDQVEHKERLVYWLLAGTLISIVAASQLLNVSPIMANILGYYFPQVSFLFIKSSLAFAILVIPTCFFGSVLPLLINLVTERNSLAPKATGMAYAINTVGGILGSACAGLWLIPTFGSEVTLKILLGILVIGFAIYAFLEEKIQKSLATVGTIALAVLVFASPAVQFKNIIKSATYTWPDPDLPFNEVMNYFSKDYEQIRFIYEGKTAIISLNHEMEYGEPLEHEFRLKTNGLNESYYDMNYLRTPPKFEALLGLLPYSFLDKVENAFIVGYGGGYSVDVLSSLDIDNVYVAELEEGIIKAADYIYEGENPILERENLTMQIEDARFVLNAKKSGPYDIIVSQPSHSWLSGVANLFTLEFFKTVKSNLKSGGIYSQWLNLYNMDEGSLKSILHTFYQVFPYGALFTDRVEGELILLGSNLPLQFNFEKIQKLADDPKWQNIFYNIPLNSPYDLLSNFSMSRDTVVKITKGSPLNTDINAYAEVRQSSVFYSSDSQQELVQPFLAKHFDGRLDTVSSVFAPENHQAYEKLIESMGQLEKYEKYMKLLKKYEASATEKPELFASLARLCFDIERLHCAKKFAEESFKQNRSVGELHYYISTLLEGFEFDKAIEVYKGNRDLKDKSLDCLYANALLNKEDLKAVKPIIDNAKGKYQSYVDSCGPEIGKIIGHYEILNGRIKEGLGYLEKIYESFPSNLEVLALLTQAYYRTNQWKSARSYSNYFDDVYNNNLSRIYNLIEHYKANGWTEDVEALYKKIEYYEK